MFYRIFCRFVQGLLILLNGFTKVRNKSRLPEGNFVLVGPHRSWLDPVYYGIYTMPKQLSFMAKVELFKNPVMRWLITKLNAFPVNRENPGPSVIKIPVKILKETDRCVAMFPSGTRHSTDNKAGAAVIAKMAKVPVVPIVYQGPTNFKGLLLRRKTAINFGDPIYIQTKEDIANFDENLKAAFAQLDRELNPDYVDVRD